MLFHSGYSKAAAVIDFISFCKAGNYLTFKFLHLHYIYKTMKKTSLLIFLFGIFLLFSCKDKSAQSADNKGVKSAPIHSSDPMNPVDVASKLEHATSAAAEGETALEWAGDKDPVCGMKVKEGNSDTLHYGGKVYGFCSGHCKSTFQKDPQKYLAKSE